jgi:HEAT repeats
MTHEKARELFSDYVVSGANPEANPECRAHLAECAQCRDEWQSVRGVWNAMEELPEMEPSPEMRTRFYQMLEAYEAGRHEAAARVKPAHPGFWSWLQQPVFQFAAGMAMLAIGVAVGHYAMAPGGAAGGQGTDVAQLRGEVQNMRQLMTLSLLQQQSAADRLQGVTWSYRVPSSDTEVLSALLNTVNHDPSVDVRLSAVDALKAMSASSVARRGLVQALAKQTSPLVESAIVDALVDLRERDAVSALQTQLAKPDMEPTMRKKLEAAVKQLE